MANDIEALMGLLPPDEGAKQRALAQQLRGEKNLGDFYSLSPTVGDFGRNMSTRALNTAVQAGGQRNTALTQARQAEQDKLARQKWEQTLAGYDDIKQYQDADGNIKTMGVSRRTGQPEEIPAMEGLKEYSDPTAGKNIWKSKLATGEEVLAHRDGTVTIPGYGTFTSMAEAEADSLSRMGQGKRNIATETQRGTDEAKEVQTTIDNFVETRGTLDSAAASYDQIALALESGAWSGPMADWLPTLDNATAQLQSELDSLTLNALKRHKLTPVSDKDLEYVKRSAHPNLRPEALLRWAKHKAEASRRMAKANAYMEEWYRENERVPTGKTKELLESRVNEILKGDGFKFEFDVRAEDKIDGKTPASTPSVSKPDWIDANSWNAYTPEQQRQLSD